jgi:hypothetical protein
VNGYKNIYRKIFFVHPRPTPHLKLKFKLLH